MGQVVQGNGDYTIKASEGGTIHLDTGSNIGFVQITGNLLVNGITTAIESESEIRFDINGVTQAIINSDGLIIDNIQINNNTIKNISVLDRISFDSVISLKAKAEDQPSNPGYVSLYAKSFPGTGGTGVFFVNTEGPPDELISKTKAFLYSLIL
jgi:hypothetical protein